MTKKIAIPLIVALLVSLLVSGVALAADDDPNAPSAFGGRISYGEVTEITADNFTVQTWRGGAFTYQVDENTRFRSSEIEEPGFGDMQVGYKVLVIARPDSDGLLTARIVALLPGDFDPSQWFGVRARGDVTAVDLAASTFTLHTPAGEDKTFTVVEHTRFIGQAASLEDLLVGWVAGVAAKEQDDGTLLASVLITAEQPRRVRHAGTVTGVDVAASTLALNTRQGEDLTFVVDDDTRFHSRNGEIEGLADLQPDMIAIVFAQPQSDGTLLAIRVAAGSPDDLPNFDVKSGGQVAAIGADSFTIQPHDGDEVTFLVSEETNFRSPGGSVHSLEDLEVGMVALVGGDDLGDGEYLAKLVIAGQAPSP